MPSLVETCASAAVGGAVLALVTASMASGARTASAASQLTAELFRARQLEHLVDRAVLAAGAGPSHPAAVTSLSSGSVALAADLDGSGGVDATTSETTALEVVQDGGTAKIRVRLGRQTMTVLEAEDSDATLGALDRHGRDADAATACVVELAITARDPPPGEDAARRVLFAIPARVLP